MDPSHDSSERPKTEQINNGIASSKLSADIPLNEANSSPNPPQILQSQTNLGNTANNKTSIIPAAAQIQTQCSSTTFATSSDIISGVAPVALPVGNHGMMLHHSSNHEEQHQIPGLRPAFNNVVAGAATVSSARPAGALVGDSGLPNPFSSRAGATNNTAVDPNPAINSAANKAPAAPFSKDAGTTSSTATARTTSIHAVDTTANHEVVGQSLIPGASSQPSQSLANKDANIASLRFSGGVQDTAAASSDLMPSKSLLVGPSSKKSVGVSGQVGSTAPANGSAITVNNNASSSDLRSTALEDKGGANARNAAYKVTPNMAAQKQPQHVFKQPVALNNPRLGAPSAVHGGVEGALRAATAVQNNRHKPPLQVMQTQPPPQRLRTVGATKAAPPPSLGRVMQPQQHRAPVMQQMRANAPPPHRPDQRCMMPQQAPQPPPVKELKVEDALLYLDQVKEAFGDRPRIYNEFLEIMKNFKSQHIDTPGVIKRVSSLFYGYNNLILGFNTFLPEGFKIELRDLEQQEAEHKRQQQHQQQQHQQQQQQQNSLGVGRGKPQQLGPGGHIGGPRYPSQQPHPHHFQPPPQLPSQPPPQQPPPKSAAQARQMPQQQQQQQQHQLAPPQLGAMQPSPRVGLQVGFQPIQPSGPPGPPRMPHGLPAGQIILPPQEQQHPTVEFDHAINYVTKIKRRFERQPQIYQQFLEILHTYQKEQRGIKEVLEQVSSLFANHPDLLREFTYFLPDAVQEQAKERLNRAVMESEARLQAAAREGSQNLQASRKADLVIQQQHRLEQAAKQQADKGAEGPIAQKHSILNREKSIESPVSRTGPITTATSSFAAPRSQHPPQPETYVYNAAVERQFFDTLKEALTSNSRDGGVAWAEFLKCLDLFAQEVLSRVELLGYVEELLGKRNADLFDEFKRILAAAGSPSAISDDTWFAVPLSEIDFTRCRKCSPSYRALPRDYPVPPCSDRLDLELSVLNDVWVSLPVGSEESYTFRHMRRNQHEETLFRVEDERFEIDMAIDSNASTLRRLEPIAEEISLLSRKELLTTPLLENAADSKSQNAPAHQSALSKKSLGAGGKQFQYVLDKNILTTIHTFSIMRIYGDLGQAMIKLLFSNPTKTVPIVVKRLRQKDREWRAARIVLNRRWKDLVDQNYIKCLDHRSLTWRTLDKRATSTRTLLAEIRDRASNNGMESEPALVTKREKAREEYGSFYEVTMGRSLRNTMDLSNYPKPTTSIFTPHLSVTYENISWAHLDAYRVLAFALERGANISPVDKDRGHRLLRDFIGPLFGLNYSLLYGYGISTLSLASVVRQKICPDTEEAGTCEEDVKMSNNPCDSGANITKDEASHPLEKSPVESSNGLGEFSLISQQPVADGTDVATVFGEGTLMTYRGEDNVFVVQLAFGTSYLQPTAIICSLQPVPQSSLTDEMRAEDKEELPPGDVLLMGNQSLYLFFRLHDVLIKRLNVAKKIAYEVSERGKTYSSVETIISNPPDDPLQVGRKRYESYLSLLYSLLEGTATTAEGDKYEDRLRSLMGHYAFELATMDKLVAHLLKNLLNMGNDEILNSLIQLYKRHLDAGSFKPNAFRQEAAFLSEGEMIYAFQYSKIPNSDQSIMHYEYLGCISESDGEEDSVAGEARERRCIDEINNDSDGEGNSSLLPTSKRQKR